MAPFVALQALRGEREQLGRGLEIPVGGCGVDVPEIGRELW
ncbi:MAG TPA: hypothetical protein VG147_08560 [Solirubrobacteraceae bacterium]|nr:hypothetical protein [Solirubrobacteraceae bacterium]